LCHDAKVSSPAANNVVLVARSNHIRLESTLCHEACTERLPLKKDGSTQDSLFGLIEGKKYHKEMVLVSKLPVDLCGGRVVRIEINVPLKVEAPLTPGTVKAS